MTTKLPINLMSATGSPSSSTFLRGDNTWATPAGSGTVTTSGSPASGNLTKFSGSTAITNGDLAGDVTTSGTLTTTVAKISGTTVSGTSGSGNVAFTTSPVFTTPNIGTATGSVSGNSGTATALQTARNIGGVSFDGTADIVPQTIQSNNEATDTTCFPLFITASGTQSLQPKNNTTLTFNSNTGALGATSFSGAGTGLTGTAASLTAGTVTTNANLTGVITSSGNATSIASQTGTGTKFVVDTSPTLVTPVLGVATATTVNKVTLTAPASGSTLTIADGKTLTASNTVTLTGTDGVSANVSNLKVRTIGFSTTSPVTGQQGSYVVFPVAGTITGYKIVADAGTCTVKTWKIASGTTAPTSGNSISTSGVSLSSGTAIISSTTSDFTSTTVSSNDIFGFELTATATATKILFELEITVT